MNMFKQMARLHDPTRTSRSPRSGEYHLQIKQSNTSNNNKGDTVSSGRAMLSLEEKGEKKTSAQPRERRKQQKQQYCRKDDKQAPTTCFRQDCIDNKAKHIIQSLSRILGLYSPRGFFL